MLDDIGSQASDRRRHRALVVAASLRILLGLFALGFLPLFYPKLAAFRWLFAVYLGLAAVMLALIYRRIGGELRTVLDGIVDLTMLTFVVQRVGSASTMLVGLYVFTSVLNSLVVRRRVAFLLAGVAISLYAGIEFGETVGLLPYGPDAPDWASTVHPGATAAGLAAALVAIMTLTGTTVVALLDHELRARERELGLANRKLETLSQQDALTLLFNRRHIVASLERELARVRRGKTLAVLMLDLDGFKQVNDQHGHLRGDAVLQQIAAALDRATREEDIVGRYGGDEFVVLLPDAEKARAAIAAERLVAAVRAVGTAAGTKTPVTASAGVAIAHAKEGSRALLRRADEAAYLAKQQGGNAVVFAPDATPDGEPPASLPS